MKFLKALTPMPKLSACKSGFLFQSLLYTKNSTIMKKIFFFAIIASFAFTSVKFDNSKASALVNQYEGIYVYTDSKPAQDFEYLGTVKPADRGWAAIGINNSSHYTSVRDKLIKNARKNFPDAEGLILTLSDGGIDKADVIKFKQ